MRHRRIFLSGDATAPRRARAFLEECQCEDHSAEVLEEAKLLVSELVTNAYKYGSPPIELAVECVGEKGLQVRVRDAGADGSIATEREAGEDDLSAEHGRGLRLVDLLSDSWGVATGPDGKDVWFRVRQAPRSG